MRHKILTPIFVVLLLAGAGTAVGLTYGRWYPWLFPGKKADDGKKKPQAHGDENRIRLSDSARKNFVLVEAELKPSYPKTLRLPGKITPRPGRTTRKVSMPVTSVVKIIHAFPGEVVRPGDKLFTLHLHYHEIHKTQAELFKTVKEIDINKTEQKRLKDLKTVVPAVLRELSYQQKRLEVARTSLRENLRLHEFTKPQIDNIERGVFVTERVIRVPGAVAPETGNGGVKSAAASANRKSTEQAYEVGHLHVKIGDQVEAGKTLCELADHRMLFVEARVFQSEIAVVQNAILDDKRVNAVVLNAATKKWEKTENPLLIRFIDQHVDAASQTAGVYLPLSNEKLDNGDYERDGKRFRLWKYRPGQRVYVEIPVGELKDVFVLPAAAIAREGPEAYVFRENGSVLERQAVHILHQNPNEVVIANDNSILQGDVIAQNGAAQLQRALKMKTGGGGGHQHHGHSHP